MPEGFSVELAGFDEFIAKLGRINEQLPKDADRELSIYCNKVVSRAKTMAPSKSSKLRNSIAVTNNEFLDKSIQVGVFYGPYVEFGTGINVFRSAYSFQPEVRAYAADFFVNGKGVLFPSPFLFPAIDLEKENFVKAIRDKVLNLNEK